MDKKDMLELRSILQEVSGHDDLTHKVELICKTIELSDEIDTINKEIQEMNKKED